MSVFILSAFGDEISPDLSEQTRVLKAHGIHSLELRGMGGQSILQYSLKEVKQAADFLSAEGIAVSAVGSPIGKIPITDQFAPHLDRFKYTLEIAHVLHTQYIRMFSFYLASDQDPVEYRDEVLNRWRHFIEAAQGSGLTLLHENEKGIYGETAKRCLDLLDTLSSKIVGATFDPANFVQCGVETYPHAYQLLRKHIRYMHIKDALALGGSVVPAGQGDGHVLEILRDLKASGFTGYLSIEPHLQDSLPGGGPEKFAIAANALKNLLAQV